MLYHGPRQWYKPGREGEEAMERREYKREQERMRKRGERMEKRMGDRTCQLE